MTEIRLQPRRAGRKSALEKERQVAFMKETVDDSFPRHREIVRLEFPDLTVMESYYQRMQDLSWQIAQTFGVPIQEESFSASLEAVAQRRQEERRPPRHRR